MFFAAKTNGNPHLNSLILDKIILPDTETDFENNRGSKGGWAQFTNVQKLMKDETRRSKKLLIQLLKSRGIQFEKGLTNEELITVEANFDITFPPDLQTLLCLELPVSKEFVNWRKALSSKEYEDEVFDKLNRPLEGMLFDIENNAFWDENWGEKPEIFEQQKEIATQNFKKYPKLIPIYSNRYIPSKPHETGNPILSVHQMDIIYYGFDLATYFRNEFHLRLPDNFEIPQSPKYIEFWSEHTS